MSNLTVSEKSKGQNLISILLTVLPVFLILGAGYLAARTNYVTAEMSAALNAFTIKVAIPVLLFKALYLLDFNQAFHSKMLVSFFSGGFVCFVITIFLARTFWNRNPGEAVAVGFCSLFSNLVLMGIAISNRAYGDSITSAVFGIISLHAATMYTLGMISMEIARSDGQSMAATIKHALSSLIKNPLIIGTLLGAIFNVATIPLPEFATAAINMLAGAGIPAALFGLGITLTQYKLKAELSEAMMVACITLFLFPAIALFLSHYVFGLDKTLVQATVILAAMPPGLNIYIFASMYKRAEALAASTIILATVISIFTISGWIWVLDILLK